MVLVLGATGMVGSEVCRLLIEKKKPVKAVVRSVSDLSKVDNLKKMGVMLVQGDLRDPSSYGIALREVDSVISTVSSMPFSYIPGENDIHTVDLVGMRNFIDEANSMGVKHFIYVSFSKQLNLEFPLAHAKRSIENHLMTCGLSYTIFRPSCFMEVWLSSAVGFDAANARVNLCGDGDKPISYISSRDVAKFIVESLHNPSAINKEIELGGPQPVTQLEAVEIFEKASGRKFDVKHTTVETLDEQRLNAPDPMQKSFSGLMECIAMGNPIDMEDTLKVFPIKMMTVRDFAKISYSEYR